MGEGRRVQRGEEGREIEGDSGEGGQWGRVGFKRGEVCVGWGGGGGGCFLKLSSLLPI